MSCTVIWRPSDEAKLAEIWSQGPNRDQIAAAADSIDSQLRQVAATAGEARWEFTRILVVPPLAVYYDYLENDRQASSGPDGGGSNRL